jgi:hypothetical protein
VELRRSQQEGPVELRRLQQEGPVELRRSQQEGPVEALTGKLEAMAGMGKWSGENGHEGLASK